ncbi:Aste57867_18400 [Aphanomyces stellatus]|uniref:Aste57867_18400 protein n=1 Tax=Aphanomyces stellatus TaxID=120398 RepID=A0A485LA03_9STRA|nr:hypothetical protein As57867_018338 [Aphanomyces stellatus]VFT95136.1 Aste57867_18400 [Aphanomyces stellatus]
MTDSGVAARMYNLPPVLVHRISDHYAPHDRDLLSPSAFGRPVILPRLAALDVETPPRPRTIVRTRPRSPEGVIDLTQDDDEANTAARANILAPSARLITQPMCKRRKLDFLAGRRSRNIRFDRDHIQSAECTQVCLDNQIAMELYRKSTTCAICLDTLSDLTSTTCGHLFCRGCIVNAIRATSKCPICQKPMTPASIHPMHL